VALIAAVDSPLLLFSVIRRERMKDFACISLTLTFAISVGVLSGCKVPDEEQIRDVVHGYGDAYNDKDIDKVMSFFSDDSKRVRSYAEGHIATGKEAVRETFVEEFEKIGNIEGTPEIPTLNVSGEAADVIYIYRMEFTELQENEIRVVATGKGTVKLRKTGGIWKITELEETIDSWERQE
jgi:ketosteroid isomerase-like protein